MFKPNRELRYRNLTEDAELGTMVHGEKTLMAKFRLKKGATIAVHDHPHEQIGVLISGHIILTIDGQEHTVSPGDSWCIHGSVPHAARAVEDSVAIEVFSPVREDYLA